MSTLECARLAFEREYDSLASRAKAACKKVPRPDRPDACQEWLCRLWRSYAERIEQEQVTDVDLALIILAGFRPRIKREVEPEQNWESLEIPDWLDPIDGILVTGFVQGDSDSELASVTGIPRRSVPDVALATMDRIVPVLTLRACCALLARLDIGAPNELADIGEIIDYVSLRVSILTGE